MKKMNKLLASSLIVAGAVSSAQAADTFKQSVKESNISGMFRLAHIQHSPDTGTETEAGAFGGIIKMETSNWNGFQFAVAPYFSQKIGALSGDEDKGEFNGDYSDDNNDSFAYLGEAYMNYGWGNGSFRFGRQLLDTPLINTDEIRMLPNSFFAGWATLDLNENFKLQGGIVKQWAGFDSGGDQSDFKDASNDGVMALGAEIGLGNGLGIQAWHYDFDENYTTIYADVSFSAGDLEVGAQFGSYDEDNNSGVDGTVTGVMASYAMGPITLGVAINETDNDPGKSIDLGLGGGNYYASMDEMTIGGLTNAEATVVSAEFAFTEAFSATLAVGHFEDEDKATTDTNETDIILSLDVSEELNAEFVHTDVENDSDPASDFSRQQIRVTYTF